MDSQLHFDVEASSRQCSKSFEKFIGALEVRPDRASLKPPTRAVENDFSRFKIWCGNLGALQTGSSSLDARLRDSRAIREAVVAFLTNLNECLQICTELATGGRSQHPMASRYPEYDDDDHEGDRSEDFTTVSDDGSSDTSDTSDEGLSDLEKTYQESREALDGLNRLAFKIRNANHRPLSSRALSYKMLDKETGEDLFLGYAVYDRKHVCEFLQQSRRLQQSTNASQELSSDSVDAFLIERMSKAITNRRRCFAYWYRHSLKLSRPDNQPHHDATAPKAPITSGKSRLENFGSKSGVRSHGQGSHTLRPINTQAPETMLSVTDFSRNLKNLDASFDKETVISLATTARDVDGQSADIPGPPLEVYSKPEFLCPYCSVLCPSRQGRGKFWRMHVLQDIQPYVCTIAECPDGDILYPTRGAWIEHERLCHRRVWRCPDRQHSTKLYHLEEELHSHLLAEHPDKTEEQIQDLVSLTETTVEDVRNTCPFCASHGPFPGGLYNHMAFHQEKLALFSLPLNLNLDHDDEAASGNALGLRSEGSLDDISLRFSDVSQSTDSINGGRDDADDGRLRDHLVRSRSSMTNPLHNPGSDAISESNDYDGALREASLEGDEDAVQALLEKGVSVDAISGDHGTALQAAASKGHDHIVALLLREGADVNAPGGLHGNALQAACARGHVQVAKMLLNSGADVNAPSELHGSALQAACSGGHVQVLQLLLDSGADVNAQGGKAGNALAAAASQAHAEIVELLLERGADVNASCGDFGTTLGAASYGGSVSIVELLLEQGVEINQSIETYGTALGAAIAGENPAVVETLLSNGADVHREGGQYNNALGVAAYKGNRPLFDRFLALGANIHASGLLYPNILGAAAAGGQGEIVKLLLENGTDINQKGGFYGSALASAADSGEDKVIELLLGRGADVSNTANNGNTPLHFASSRGKTRAVDTLLDHGADMKARTDTGWTPLHWASLENYVSVMRLLLHHGAEVDDVDDDERTALFFASSKGHLDAVKILLDKKADLTLADTDGWTPLSVASYYGHVEVVRLLVEEGADFTATKRGDTPLSLAANEGHPAVVQVLLLSGADLSDRGYGGFTPLNGASAYGHLSVVKLMLSWNADTTIPNAWGNTPLNSACLGGHMAVAQLLLENGAYEAAQGLDQVYGTIVHLLALKGFTNSLRFVVEENDADLHQLDRHKHTALHMAARSGSLETFQYVASKGLDFAAVDSKGDNLVNFAASGGSLEVVNEVLTLRSDLIGTCGVWSPLHWACRAGKVDVIEFLLASGWKATVVVVPDLPGNWTPLAIAMFHGNADSMSNISEQSRADLGAADGNLGDKGNYHESGFCNGCYFYIYGPRFQCFTCAGVDYCFMCKFLLEDLHKGHGWKKFESWDSTKSYLEQTL